MCRERFHLSKVPPQKQGHLDKLVQRSKMCELCPLSLSFSLALTKEVLHFPPERILCEWKVKQRWGERNYVLPLTTTGTSNRAKPHSAAVRVCLPFAHLKLASSHSLVHALSRPENRSLSHCLSVCAALPGALPHIWGLLSDQMMMMRVSRRVFDCAAVPSQDRAQRRDQSGAGHQAERTCLFSFPKSLSATGEATAAGEKPTCPPVASEAKCLFDRCAGKIVPKGCTGFSDRCKNCFEVLAEQSSVQQRNSEKRRRFYRSTKCVLVC